MNVNQRTISALVIAALSTFGSHLAQANGQVSKFNAANQALVDGKLEEALAQYDSVEQTMPGSPLLAYNRGVGLYRQGQIDHARQSFTTALETDDPELAAKAWFNLGNCHYATAIPQLETDPAVAMESLQTAIAHYRSALKSNPSDTDSRTNIELANQLVKKLKKEEQEEQQEQKKQEQQQQQDQESDSQEPSESNQEKNDQSDSQDKQSDESDESDEQESNQSKPKQEQSDQSSSEQDDAQNEESDDANSDQQNKEQTGEENKDQKQSKENSSDSGSDESKQQTKDKQGEHQNESGSENEEQNQQPGQQQQPGDDNDDQQAQPQPGASQQENPNESGTGQQMSAGNAAQQDQTDEEQQAPGFAASQSGELGAKIDKEEAMKMLQAIRDRDLMRRTQKLNQTRRQHRPVDRDW